MRENPSPSVPPTRPCPISAPITTTGPRCRCGAGVRARGRADAQRASRLPQSGRRALLGARRTAEGRRPPTNAPSTLAEEARKVNPRQADVPRTTGRRVPDGWPRSRGARDGNCPRAARSQKRPAVLFVLVGVYQQLGDRATARAWLKKLLPRATSASDRTPRAWRRSKDPRYVRLTAK